MTLKELRKSKGLTQVEASAYLGVSLRSYHSYENSPEKQNTIQYRYMLERMREYGLVDETNGILSVEKIRLTCAKIFKKYAVSYAYLFGSYAKGKATEKSDVDLFLSTEITGIRFFELAEELRENLKKKVDLIDQRQLNGNLALTEEILKDGIKIYG